MEEKSYNSNLEPGTSRLQDQHAIHCAMSALPMLVTKI